MAAQVHLIFFFCLHVPIDYKVYFMYCKTVDRKITISQNMFLYGTKLGERSSITFSKIKSRTTYWLQSVLYVLQKSQKKNNNVLNIRTKKHYKNQVNGRALLLQECSCTFRALTVRIYFEPFLSFNCVLSEVCIRSS